MGSLKTPEQYEQELHESEIDYWPLEAYKGAKIPILHFCLCGHEWLAQPQHILQGKGCPKCKGGTLKSHATYLSEITDLDITCVDLYVNWSTPITHKCKQGHIWKSAPHNVLKGQGCPSCADYGFNTSKPALLYFIKIGEYYKIGITNRSVAQRFSRDKDKAIEILREVHFQTGAEARIEEQRLLKKYEKYRTTVIGYLKSGGNTELFREPVWL